MRDRRGGRRYLVEVDAMASAGELLFTWAYCRDIHRQATMVAFVEIFTLLGAIFLCLVPLVFIMKRPRGKAAVGAH